MDELPGIAGKRTLEMLADGASLYQLHNNGLIWQYRGVPFTGWLNLDNNAATVGIAAGGGTLYQLHSSSKIWRYTGPPITGWQRLF